MNEAHNIEWKQSWRDEYLKWICAFANSDGGVLFTGKNDKGALVHLSKFQSLLEDIRSRIKNFLGIILPVNLHDNEGRKIKGSSEKLRSNFGGISETFWR
jgi:ATP-dependent DNA helicase RecG